MACQLEAIDYKLDDSAFFVEMCRVILGEEIQTFTKPDFSQCYNVENVLHEVTDVDATVIVYLKVLLPVNETFEFKVQTDWGIRAENINPFYSKAGENVKKEFIFRKRPNRDWGEIKFFADGLPLSHAPLKTRDVKEENKKNFRVKSISFNMIRVEHGAFMMGATEEQEEPNDDEKPVHKVILTYDYYIGETQVTQGLWVAVMGDNPSYFKETSSLGNEWECLPVENVSWDDCQNFIRKLNELTGKKFRIPTEAEWEFAARGGNLSRGYQYSGSNDPNEVAWFSPYFTFDSETHPVATKKANELGLYDMSGNVCEWCSDWKTDYNSSTQYNPTFSIGSNIVVRGGSFLTNANHARVSCRDDYSPEDAGGMSLGLRLCLSE